MYKQLGTTQVIKKAINGNIALAEEYRLWNDLTTHKKVVVIIMNGNSAQYKTTTVLVPRCYRYIKENICWKAPRMNVSGGGSDP